ncbi:polysaccharide deacetylase family protein [Pseudoduganella sp. GCM10020061]|uniref:polysaccharide deacetylase family protein n=1 Tax=Pseudoduganella sp. GCM10020061 TaxID=3317345 RepID=UPI003643A7FB
MSRRPFTRALLSVVAPGGARGLSILVYHRVLPHADPLFPAIVDAERFSLQLDLLRRCFNVLPLPEALARMRTGSLPPRAACITFDDGYADNEAVALPLLRAHGLHATFFIATGFLDGGRMWNDTVIETVRRAPVDTLACDCLGLGMVPVGTPVEKRMAVDLLLGALKYRPMHERVELAARIADGSHARLPNDLMMTTAQVRSLHAAGMEIGAHTVHHPILATLRAPAARHEIACGRDALEAITGGKVGLFAYPNGKPGQDYLPEHVGMVRALGFDGAVSTAWGAGGDAFQLPRFTPWDRSPLRFALRLAHNLTYPAALAA